MGTVRTAAGTDILVEEVDGIMTLAELYKEIKCNSYRDSHRISLIKAAGKLGRQGWGILHTLHELSKELNGGIAEAASEAIKKIDPGRPNLQRPVVSGTSFRDTPDGPIPFADGIIPSLPNSCLPRKEDKRFVVIGPNGNTSWHTPEVKKVILTDIPGDLEDNTRIYGTCCFCEKYGIFPKLQIDVCNKIAGTSRSGARRLFCNFCLRNEFFKLKHQRNQLMMSFRGLIGYYYYSFHVQPKITGANMWLSELEGIINLHIKMGVQNPIFRYDPETFCWYVDFSKVGTHNRQMPLSYVLDTTAAILSAFNIYEHLPGVSSAALFNKFREAVVDFHHHRRRPGKRLLAPTPVGCGIPHDPNHVKAIPDTWLKNFVPSHMVENHKRQRS